MRVAVAGALVALCGLAANQASAGVAPQDALAIMRSLRLSGCEARSGVHAPLRVNAALNNVAAQWSRGTPLRLAIVRSGYREDQSAGLHVSGDLPALRPVLTQRLCTALTDASMADAGIFQRGQEIWIVVAAPFAAPTTTAAGSVASDVLRLVNAARAQPQRCGRSAYPPAAPLKLNELLVRAAQAHAEDMLRYEYFEHAGHDGSTPAQRVAATGYDYRVVGENLASGPETPEEAVRGWLASPGHCQNIMDARFAELGVAFAATRVGPPRIYWVQEFAAARSMGERPPSP